MGPKMAETPHYLVDVNLSRAWARAFLAVMERGVKEISPLTVTVEGLDEGRPPEEPAIRRALDDALAEHGEFSCHTVANTIFPMGLWTPGSRREKLYERYAKILPVLKKADTRNQKGTYFQRLTSFGTGEINQLEHIITTYTERGNPRRSALQASIFDPAKDHTDQRQRGFPCLQYVSFAPFDKKTKLRVTGVYATQYLFEKAYGNYLGLYELGCFMAHELDLELAQLNCIASVAARGKPSKESLRGLAAKLEPLLEEPEKAATHGAVA
jgi:hypothetical protein